MKDYRLTIKVRNNRLLKAIEYAGGTLGQKWCEANGLSYSRVNQFVNMTESPLAATGELRSAAARLCEVLGKLPEDLWSNEQLYPLERNFSEMEMDHAEIVALLPPEQQSYLPDFSAFEREQARALLTTAMAGLKPNERTVLQWRFEEDLTFEECAQKMGLTRERIRQIEAKAIRALKHPTRAAGLVDLVDLDEDMRASIKESAKDYEKRSRARRASLGA